MVGLKFDDTVGDDFPDTWINLWYQGAPKQLPGGGVATFIYQESLYTGYRGTLKSRKKLLNIQQRSPVLFFLQIVLGGAVPTEKTLNITRGGDNFLIYENKVRL